jgi:hypothetical protein
MPTLRRQIIIAPGLPPGRPPKGWAFRYSLARSADGVPFYVGQTQQAPADWRPRSTHSCTAFLSGMVAFGRDAPLLRVE